MSIYAELQPVYITGNFSLAPDTAAFRVVPARQLQIGSWKDQGLDLYGHEVVYTKTFEVKDPHKEYFVNPGKWKGTVALLNVNDKQAAILFGNETKCDIGKYLHTGINKADLIIVGSLKNTLGPHYNKPAPGMASPWHWRYVYKPLPGKEYDLYDYGLNTDFTILQYRQ